MEEQDFTVRLKLEDGYRIDADFGDPAMADLRFDEPPPLGDGAGPNAARVLGAAVGNCLSASLLYCLRRSRIAVEGLETEVRGRLARNANGRWRVMGLQARILTAVPPEDQPRMQRCIEIFEEFCIVSASVREGITIDVEVDVADPADARTVIGALDPLPAG